MWAETVEWTVLYIFKKKKRNLWGLDVYMYLL